MEAHHLLYHARSRASVGCGGQLNSVSEARQHLGIAARRDVRASFQRAALEHGRVSNWRLRRVATQTCLATMMFQGVCSTRETEKKILPGFGLTKLDFLGEFVEGQGKSSLKGEGFVVRDGEISALPIAPLKKHL